jgi:acetoacetate decarboxylase
MAVLRYVKTPAQLSAAAQANPEFLNSRVRSVRCVYETDAKIAAALVPQPLQPADRPEVCVTFSHVAMQITPDFTFEIGSAVFGVKASYEGIEGIYIITMPMTAEAAVVGGRETFGEPKKIADIRFDRKGDDLHASVSRMGMIYLAFDGHIGKPLPVREFVEHAYCFKAFPSCEQGKAFDYEPLLVRLEWRQKHDVVHELDGKLLLGESPLDPVADVPVRKLVRLEYEEGTTQSNGKVLRPVPGEWVLPFLHQRYDDTSGAGIEI